MEKVRVYELAKELNTTSKRLMEKLAEINVEVKNHMSLLEEDQLKALYKHIGIIKHEEDQRDEPQEEKKAPPVQQAKPETKRDQGKENRSIPRIIRKTEVVIDSRNELHQVKNTGRNDIGFGGSKGNQKRDRRNEQKWDVIRGVDDSGLRAGFVRNTRPEYMKVNKPPVKPEHDGQNKAKETEVNEPKQVQRPVEEKESKPAVGITASKEMKLEKPMEKPAEKIEEKPIEKTPEKLQESFQTNAPELKAEKPQEKPVEKAPEKPVEKALGVEGNQENQEQKHEGKKNDAQPRKDDAFHRRDGQPPRQEGAHQKRDGQPPRPDNRRGDRPDRGDRPFKPQENRQGPGASGQAMERKPDGGFNKGPFDKKRGPGERTGPQGRPGDRQNDRPGERKPQGTFRPGGRPLEIPKPELSAAQLEELSSQRGESRREFVNRDLDKDMKREQKKEVLKGQPGEKAKKFKPQSIVLTQKKGVHEILSEDFILDEFYSDDGMKKSLKKPKPKKDTEVQKGKHIPHKAVLTSVTISDSITVKDLAETLKKTSAEVIRKLMNLGMMVALNQEIDYDTAAIVAEEFGIKAEKAIVINEEDILFDDADENPEELEPRPPVVVVMGHVDHGKTSLLDAIRESNVTESEAGGITQHIGAYMVKINGRNITFLDTPGHEAFTAMRARGAQVTDIAILVVAADDGVMPQTIEAINHAKAANVAIIVAVNKIDKPGANPEKVKQELAQQGLVVEEWGGDVISVPVSAKNRTNIDQLLEMVLLTADILELKANPNRQAKGTVIEAKLDKAKGPIATLLVQRGTLKVGDSIVTGTTVGRIRAMVDDKGNNIKKAKPSTPVEILGLPEVPDAGEIFYAIDDERIAKHLAEKRRNKIKEQQMKATARVSLDDLFNQIKEGKVKDLNIIVKADVQGSVEAVKQSLAKLSNDEVRVKIIHDGVGAITESDVSLAEVSNAIIIGFNVRPGANVMDAAKSANVDIRLYRIIYDAIEDIQAAMKGMLEPTFREVVQGHAEIRQTFKVSGIGTIGGCYVTDGKIARNSDIRIVRDGIVVHEGKLASLKRFKDDAKEVAQGFECGLSVERFNDLKEGDIVEAYVMEEVKR